MSWYSKVAWKEGLFLQPHHLQQADRYMEHLLRVRTAQITPYPWGVSNLVFDRDLAQQGRIGLRSIVGIFPDGLPFDAPNATPLPTAVPVPEEEASGLGIWLTLPDIEVNAQDVAAASADNATRYLLGSETVVDNSSSARSEQPIEIATPRLELSLRNTPKPGHQNIYIGRIADMRDGVVTLDETVPPTGMILAVHSAYEGYLSRVIGWMEAKLSMLARYASDPSSGGGMQATDYLMLMVINRELPILRHLRGQGAVHPERLYEKLVSLAGELTTFDQADRKAKDYGGYRHDSPKESFTPIVYDIQSLLAQEVGRAIRLPLEEVRANSYLAKVNDRHLFANAAFVVEVSSGLPLTQVQQQFPQLCKVGPSTAMRQIINANLPGIGLVHMPNPPRQIRVIASNVYFLLDKSTDLWREFSSAPAVGMHFAGNWPDLKLELWAIPEQG
ncbi:type VI secretion system baseplate subunit TssK [Sagittula stellata]|nr:type VI secretion system baseplate subunit TssK [Sagittula stellata]